MKRTCFTIRTVDNPLKKQIDYFVLICSLIRKKKKKKVFFHPPHFLCQCLFIQALWLGGHSSSSSFGKTQTSSLYLPALLSNLICSSSSRRGYITTSSQWIAQALWSLWRSTLPDYEACGAGTSTPATPSADRKPQLRPPPIIYSHYFTGAGHLMDELVSPARPLVAQPADAD